LDKGTPFSYQPGDCVFIPNIRQAIADGAEDFPAKILCKNGMEANIALHIRGLTDTERQIILDGYLINYYAKKVEGYGQD